MISDNVRARAALWLMRQMEPGWDSYDAKTINPMALEKALVLLQCLPGEWMAVPCSDGGVHLEQHLNGVSVEVRISPQPGAVHE